ncbi:MAG: hypothetical protein ACFFCU_17060, partial [Promethearchaeota archaeon]
NSNGESTIRMVHLIYYFQADTNNIVIPFVFLLFVILTFYFYFMRKETKYFDLMPLTLIPILGVSILYWFNTLTYPTTLPRSEMYIELGLIILGISTITYYIFYLYNKKIEGVKISVTEGRESNINNNAPTSRLEERYIIFLFCLSVLPVAVTIPALGIFATHFINTEQYSFFTAYGVPILLPESYNYYMISTLIGNIIYNPIFFNLMLLFLFCTFILAIRSISKRSTIQKSEITFIVTTLVFLFLLNAITIFTYYLIFPWLIIPYLIIYDGKKDPKRLQKGITLIVFMLSMGIIIVFMQILIPIDFGLMTGLYGLDQMKLQPTLILLALPYLIHWIHHESEGNGVKVSEEETA